MDYTHTGLELVGIHEPETSQEPVGPGQYESRELPGHYTLGVEIDGAFVRLFRFPAGNLLRDIERAKQSDKSKSKPTG